MFTNADQIQAGMDVYGADGDKIGSVDGVYGMGTGSADASAASDQAANDRPNTYSGVLGDESRVGTDNASRTFGDESSVETDNATRTFGDDSASTYGNRTRTFGDETASGTDNASLTFGDESASGLGNATRTFGDESGTDSGYDVGNASAGTEYAGSAATDHTGSDAGYGSPGYGAIDVVVVEEVVESDPDYAATGSGYGTDNQYFTVKHGGILGLGSHDLYIPFSAVQDVNADENRVTLNVTKDEAVSQFDTAQAGIDQG
jgi:hypothetical protein